MQRLHKLLGHDDFISALAQQVFSEEPKNEDVFMTELLEMCPSVSSVTAVKRESTLLMSFVLETLYPKWLINIEIDSKRLENEMTNVVNKFYKEHGYEWFPIGSSAQHLSLLSFAPGVDASDVDGMFVVRSIVPDDNILFLTEETKPGYVRLKRTKPRIQYLENTPFNPHKTDMSHSIREFSVRYRDEIIHINTPLTASGPAYTALIRDFDSSKGLGPNDVTHSYHFDFWPKPAGSWPDRPRPTGWPPQDFIEEITSKGCHVVPVAHSNSTMPDIEWRISFAVAETKLALSFSEIQRQCYILFKLMVKYKLSMQPQKVISSYCLLNIMFYTMEEIPSEVWQKESGLAFCFLHLIDQLVSCLRQQNIPHYFIPETNLIDSKDTMLIEDTHVKIQKLRKSTSGTLLNLYDEIIKHKMSESVHVLPSDVVFPFELTEREKKTSHEDRINTIKICMAKLKLIRVFIKKGSVPAVVQLCEELTRDSMLIAPPSTESQTCQRKPVIFYIASGLLNMKPHDPDWIDPCDLAWAILHVLFHESDKDNTMDTESETYDVVDELFKFGMKTKPFKKNASRIAHYMLYMLHRGREDDVMDELEKKYQWSLYKQKEWDSNQTLSIFRGTLLPSELQSIVEKCKTTELSAILIILYLLIMYYVKKGNMPLARKYAYTLDKQGDNCVTVNGLLASFWLMNRAIRMSGISTKDKIMEIRLKVEGALAVIKSDDCELTVREDGQIKIADSNFPD